MPLYYDQGNAAAPPALIALILELRFHLFLAHRNCRRRRLHANRGDSITKIKTVKNPSIAESNQSMRSSSHAKATQL